MVSRQQDRTALVVDDEVFARLFATQILEDQGFVPLEADSSVEALDVLDRHGHASVLITDIGMPGDMDGLALARKVARTYPHIAIVIVSGQVRPTRDQIPGNAKFLAKPYTAHSLMSVIKEVSG